MLELTLCSPLPPPFAAAPPSTRHPRPARSPPFLGLASSPARSRSVDAHFYPTAYTTAVYEPVADVEDLDNAAFVPKEQFDAEQAALAAKAQRADKGRKALPPVRDE